ncbi:MAG: sporulation protein YqfD [Clostridia bacterium]|nr:sporulation protein YqfD [Clostridia bacterium]
MTFLWSFLRWLIGYAKIEIRGAYGEKFITLCMKQQIDLWEIRRICPGIIQAKVYGFSEKHLDALARKSGVTLEFPQRIGLPIVLKRYRFRPGIFLGIGIYLISLFFLSRFVWAVEIPGANPIQQQKIQSVLLDEGFGIGSFIPSVDYKNLRYQLMLSMEELSFVSVNMNGSRAVVEVHFSNPTPEAVDDGTPCNIVASRDGQILSMLVQSGMRYAQKGQTVQKGELLVGGIMDTRLGYYVVHAKAKIMARVTDIQTETVDLVQTQSDRTGRYKVRREWNFFGKTLPTVSWDDCPYAEYETETQVKHLSFGEDCVFPISLTETYYYETVSSQRELSPEEAELEARIRMDEADRLRFSCMEVESMEETVECFSDRLVLTRVRSVIVDICEDKAFYFED